MAQQDDWFATQDPASGGAPAPGGAGAGGGGWFDQQGGGGAPVSTTMPVPNPQAQGAGVAQGGAVNLQSGIQTLQGLVGPESSRGEMEAAIAKAFGNVPGYEQAYKESVKINGKWYDLVQGYGGAGAKWNSNPQGTTPEGGGGADGGGFGRLGGGTGSLAGIAAEALETSPGYQFRLKEGLKGVERGAAAKGTLLTGGTLKSLTRYAQDFASNEYANNYARLFGEQGARYNQLYGLAGLGAGAAGTAGQIGSSYAGQAGNLAANQAGAGADLITGGANAGAAGTIGAGNAYGQLYGNLGQIPGAVYGAGQNQAYLDWLRQQGKG